MARASRVALNPVPPSTSLRCGDALLFRWIRTRTYNLYSVSYHYYSTSSYTRTTAARGSPAPPRSTSTLPSSGGLPFPLSASAPQPPPATRSPVPDSELNIGTKPGGVAELPTTTRGNSPSQYIKVEIFSAKNLQVPSERIPAGIFISIDVDSQRRWKSTIGVLSFEKSVVWGDTVTLSGRPMRMSWNEVLNHGDEPFDISFPPVRDVHPSLTLKAAVVHECDDQDGALHDYIYLVLDEPMKSMPRTTESMRSMVLTETMKTLAVMQASLPLLLPFLLSKVEKTMRNWMKKRKNTVSDSSNNLVTRVDARWEKGAREKDAREKDGGENGGRQEESGNHKEARARGEESWNCIEVRAVVRAVVVEGVWVEEHEIGLMDVLLDLHGNARQR
ncbi:hypothetical protein EDD22DRAFT_852894 [Suillus occidentalis]|nr:hypothetical protein EDD22DRAFT_852894 [Suillus occidentalis]